MDDNIKEIGYRTIINELYKNINNHIGNKLKEIIPKDYDSDDYAICLYLILDVSKENLFDTYQALLDDVIEIENRYGITLCIITFTCEEYERENPKKLAQ